MSTLEQPTRKRIRSFVRRQGRITQAQALALENLWPIYGLDPKEPFDVGRAFSRDAPLTVEIGFGNGESLAKMAAAAPEENFLGIEVHRPGVGHLLLKVEELVLSNIRVYCADAVEILQDKLADQSLAGIQVFFPDPWHKKRHHKRRLIAPEFVNLAARKLKSGGIFHAATDWEDYARQMLEVLEGCEGLSNAAGENSFSERPDHRPLTKFEARGQNLGHRVWDLVFVRN
ncbi:MAG TPA: tRNA (guanosine(46)-N7)-methyltransferase TrmB [Methylococcaceae bacterium]|nr:tRNA (guanosine(46)-N7)-methyltransferase TrmB [Methylococcaceae bacterium]